MGTILAGVGLVSAGFCARAVTKKSCNQDVCHGRAALPCPGPWQIKAKLEQERTRHEESSERFKQLDEEYAKAEQVRDMIAFALAARWRCCAGACRFSSSGISCLRWRLDGNVVR